MLLQTHAGNPTNPDIGYWGVFMIGGEQKQTVKIVPTPVRVTGPTTVQKGDSAAWRAEVVGDFRMRNSKGQTVISWEFFPGDTLERHNRAGARIALTCQKAECTYEPRKAGRLVASTYVEGRFVSVASQVVRIDSANLELTCDRYSVTRGQSITCSVQAKPSGTLDSIRWQFTDTAGHVIPGPPDVSSWGGRIVVRGRITVTARLNGSPAADDTIITVIPRRWRRPTIVPHEEPATDLPAPANVTLARHLGDSHVDTATNPPLRGQRIDTGPNTGWWYIPNALGDIPVTVHVNYAAFQAGSAWYNLQTGGAWKDPATGITHPHGYCTKAQVATLRQLTREHEGSVASPVMSHVRAMRVYLANNAPQDSLEKVMAWDGDVQTFTFAETISSFYRAYIFGNLTGYSAPHTTDNPPGVVPPAVFPCAARPWY